MVILPSAAHVINLLCSQLTFTVDYSVHFTLASIIEIFIQNLNLKLNSKSKQVFHKNDSSVVSPLRRVCMNGFYHPCARSNHVVTSRHVIIDEDKTLLRTLAKE